MALVVGLLVTIITALTGAHDAIATTVELAVGFTTVLVHAVAIVTGFIAGFLFGQACPEDAISTTRVLAVVEASVGVDIIGVIAGLIGLKNPVATAREPAIVGALVFMDLIGIITFFHADMDEAVTASRGNAGAHTRIIVRKVAVVTTLKVHVSFAEVGS